MGYLRRFFNVWQKPIYLSVVGFVIFAIGGLTYSRFWEQLCSYFFLFTLVVLIISLTFQIVLKRGHPARYTAISFAGLLVAVFFYGIFLMFVDVIHPEDGYADDLSIPPGMLLNEPKGERLGGSVLNDSIQPSERAVQDLELYHSFQPGIYRYNVWLGRIEQGTVFLKAFEITKNDPLSPEDLVRSSRMAVSNSSDSIMAFTLDKDFTIYEGDWDKPYAARFEVWFRPINGDKERMLMEKNFKIEGWMR